MVPLPRRSRARPRSLRGHLEGAGRRACRVTSRCASLRSHRGRALEGRRSACHGWQLTIARVPQHATEVSPPPWRIEQEEQINLEKQEPAVHPRLYLRRCIDSLAREVEGDPGPRCLSIRRRLPVGRGGTRARPGPGRASCPRAGESVEPVNRGRVQPVRCSVQSPGLDSSRSSRNGESADPDSSSRFASS